MAVASDEDVLLLFLFLLLLLLLLLLWLALFFIFFFLLLLLLFQGRPDMTFVVDWALSNNYLSTISGKVDGEEQSLFQFNHLATEERDPRMEPARDYTKGELKPTDSSVTSECGTSGPCAHDYYVTGNRTIAADTRLAQESFESLRQSQKKSKREFGSHLVWFFWGEGGGGYTMQTNLYLFGWFGSLFNLCLIKQRTVISIYNFSFCCYWEDNVCFL